MIDLANVSANYALDQLYDNKFPAGTSFRVRTGAVAGAENADSGTVLATIVLPATPWAAATGGTKSKQGSWTVAASGTGIAGHYRMTGTDTTQIEEGTVTATGGGGDATIDNTSIATGQAVTVGTAVRSL